MSSILAGSEKKGTQAITLTACVPFELRDLLMKPEVSVNGRNVGNGVLVDQHISL